MDGKRYCHLSLGEGLVLTGARKEFELLGYCLERASDDRSLDPATQQAVVRALGSTNKRLSHLAPNSYPGIAQGADEIINAFYADYLPGDSTGRAHLVAVRVMRAATEVAAQVGEQAAIAMQPDLERLNADLTSMAAIPDITRRPETSTASSE